MTRLLLMARNLILVCLTTLNGSRFGCVIVTLLVTASTALSGIGRLVVSDGGQDVVREDRMFISCILGKDRFRLRSILVSNLLLLAYIVMAWILGRRLVTLRLIAVRLVTILGRLKGRTNIVLACRSQVAVVMSVLLMAPLANLIRVLHVSAVLTPGSAVFLGTNIAECMLSSVVVSVMFRVRPLVSVVIILCVCLRGSSRVTWPHVLWTPKELACRRPLYPRQIGLLISLAN